MQWPLILTASTYLLGWALSILALLVVPRKRDPGAAQAWLLFIFLVPWLGLLLFLVIGSPKLPTARRARQREIDAWLERVVSRDQADPALEPIFDHEVTPERQPIAALIQRLGGLPVLDGNAVELLADYDATTERIIADIDQASSYVNLLMYIFADDVTGRRVVDALRRAHERGVQVRVIVDQLGSRGALRRLLPQLRAAGAEVRAALPINLIGRGFLRPDLRNHRKIVVVDGLIGYAGSQNIVDAECAPGVVNEEVVARVRGPIVAELQATFLIDWFSEEPTVTVALEDVPRTVPAAPVGEVDAQVLPSGPAYSTDNVPLLMTTLLYAARSRVVITTPYFIPDAALLTAIESTARRGVEVHLIVSAQGDHFIVSRAQRSYYEEMLASGVQIHTVPAPAFIHSKHMSIDDDLVVIGSSNIDVRSFRLNLEITLVLYDQAANAALRAIEQRYLARSTELTFAAWCKRRRYELLVENTCRLISAVL